MKSVLAQQSIQKIDKRSLVKINLLHGTAEVYDDFKFRLSANVVYKFHNDRKRFTFSRREVN